jgi:prepilin-type N-terminal cleavage/methylation domain-containing protein
MNTQNTQPAPNQNGFSLVEIMIASLILTVGMMAMAGSTGYVSNQLRSVRFDTKRTVAKQQMVEQLRGTTYSSVATRSTGLTSGQFTFTWVVSTPTNNTKRVALITSGPAYRNNGSRSIRTTVVDTMSFDLLSP